jgi:1-acyl-sn-glycerol-3-phosphate acyltransferase
MIVARSVVYFFYMVVSVMVHASLMVTIGLALGYERRCRIANAWGTGNLWVLRKVCGLGYRVEGLDNLPAGNCIVMSKHQSTWETVFLRGFLPPAQAWILKRELLSVPFFGWALKVCQPIAIDRSAGRRAVKQVVDQGLAALERGRWVIVFPEGTRVAPGVRQKYASGSALLAERSGIPVLPVAHNAGVFWRRRGLRKYPGQVDVVIGPLIRSRGRKAADIMAEVEAWIEDQVARLPQTPEAGRSPETS